MANGTKKIGPRMHLHTTFLIVLLEDDVLYGASTIATLGHQRDSRRIRDTLAQFARSNSFKGYRSESNGRTGFVRGRNGHRVEAYAGDIWRRHAGADALRDALCLALAISRLNPARSYSSRELAERASSLDPHRAAHRGRLLVKLAAFHHQLRAGGGSRTSAEVLDRRLPASAWKAMVPTGTLHLARRWEMGQVGTFRELGDPPSAEAAVENRPLHELGNVEGVPEKKCEARRPSRPEPNRTADRATRACDDVGSPQRTAPNASMEAGAEAPSGAWLVHCHEPDESPAPTETEPRPSGRRSRFFRGTRMGRRSPQRTLCLILSLVVIVFGFGSGDAESPRERDVVTRHNHPVLAVWFPTPRADDLLELNQTSIDSGIGRLTLEPAGGSLSEPTVPEREGAGTAMSMRVLPQVP
ncbi:hypothetical protein [Sulfidibacter corallicola]|uniref:Uncharacterized protein n=1 Tax=Sulfidibacter corallicola TaxID=2818388 RepID=A0A8A4TCF9_SULCO|nr:hypothetical protein [Sulfidibacter corallicola]QTD47616.1 hypothetical protein J3U87_18650 [Sulfidibacter corallicola]